MILPVNAPGPTYLGKVNSRQLINKFLLICEETRGDVPLVEEVIMINPYINDYILEMLNKLASAEISPLVVANPKLDKNPLNAQALARQDIFKKIKQALPKNAFLYPNKNVAEIDFPDIIDLNKWKNQESLILLPYEKESFHILSKLMRFNLNGELENIKDSLEIVDIVNLSKVYGKTLKEKTLI